MPRRPGSLCSFENPEYHQTPGPFGRLDLGDPDCQVLPESRWPVSGHEPIAAGRPRLAQLGNAVPLVRTVKVTEPPAQPGLGPGGAELPTDHLLPLFAAKQPIKPDEVKQGPSFGDCSVPAALAALANTKSGLARIQAMIRCDNEVAVTSSWLGRTLKSTGLVTVTIAGKNYEISRLLYRQEGDLLYSRSTQSVGWVSFIEKAYALQKDGYDKIEHIDAGTVLKDFAGTTLPTIHLRESEGAKLLLDHKQEESLHKTLTNAGVDPTVAATPQSARRQFNTPHGLVAYHAYAVLGADSKSVQVWDADTEVRQSVPWADFRADYAYVFVAKP